MGSALLNIAGINFGNQTLDKFEEGDFNTLTFSCATPGDLSVSYTSRITSYQIIGNRCYFSIFISFTPTYTSASGQIRLAGFPVAATLTNSLGIGLVGGAGFTAVTNQNGLLGVFSNGSSNCIFSVSRNGQGNVALNVTQFTSGVNATIELAGFYNI